MRIHRAILVAVGLTLLGAACAKETPFDRQVEKLRSGKLAERDQTAMKLATYKAQAVPALSRALEDRSKKVRFSVIMSLADIGPAALPAVPRLAFLALAGGPTERVAAMEALVTIAPDDSRVRALFLWCLGDGDDDIRIAAITGLGRGGEPSSELVDLLIKRLEDRCFTARAEAATALGQAAMHEDRVVPALTGRLSDERPLVRRRALEALRLFGPEARSAVYAVLALYRDLEAENANKQRVAAALTLGRIGPEAAEVIPALAEGLSDEDYHIRHASARALGYIGNPAMPTLPGLYRLLADPENPAGRFEAAGAIGRIAAGKGYAEVREHLETARDNESQDEIIAAINVALDRLKPDGEDVGEEE